MQHPRIATDPKIMLGKPCIRGTRITVELLLKKLAAGDTMAEILDGYPHITEDDIKAALAFAADLAGRAAPAAAE